MAWCEIGFYLALNVGFRMTYESRLGIFCCVYGKIEFSDGFVWIIWWCDVWCGGEGKN